MSSLMKLWYNRCYEIHTCVWRPVLHGSMAEKAADFASRVAPPKFLSFRAWGLRAPAHIFWR